jgi:hypothetical protein
MSSGGLGAFTQCMFVNVLMLAPTSAPPAMFLVEFLRGDDRVINAMFRTW